MFWAFGSNPQGLLLNPKVKQAEAYRTVTKSKQMHPANIPGKAEWTPKIKVLVKHIKKKSQSHATGFFFQDKSE